MEMEGIRHRNVEVNGISMHVAEQGEGPVVLLLHGFPELWYSWRHQIAGLAAFGYHAVAPDLRGYGGTSVPPSYTSYTILHLVGDVVALMDALEQKQVFVVGHDWGAWVAWHLCMFKPDRVKAVVALSVPYFPRNSGIKPVEYCRALYGDHYYITRFQEPGDAEAEFARLGTRRVMRKFFSYREPGPLFIPREGWGSPEDTTPLPPWLTEEDLDYYARKFDESGFTGPINYYRCLDLNWELTAPWTGEKLRVPAKFIVGDQDLAYHLPGAQIYVNFGGLKLFVPLLLDHVVVMEGVAHFINQERKGKGGHSAYLRLHPTVLIRFGVCVYLSLSF